MGEGKRKRRGRQGDLDQALDQDLDQDLDKIDRGSADSFPASDPPATSNPGNGGEEGWED